MSVSARALLLSLLLEFAAVAQGGAPERHFKFQYAFTVHNSNVGQPLRVWIPLARSDAFQTVKVISKTGDLPLRETRESTYGDTMLFAESKNADKDEYKFEIVYDVVRRQASSRDAGVLRVSEKQRLLAPDKLVPTTGLPAELASKQVASVDGGDYEKGRAIYDYVLANMRYDKTGTGWGARRHAICL